MNRKNKHKNIINIKSIEFYTTYPNFFAKFDAA